jgi:nucleoside-diphosphate-sugar epimerase
MSKDAVLITGASGYLGSHLATALLKSGVPVAATVRPVATVPSGVTGAEPAQRRIPAGVIELSSEENAESLSASFKKHGIKTVYHLATNFISEHTPAQIPSLIQSNVEFGTRIAEASALAGVNRFLNIGSFWQNYEGKAYSPASLYAATKQAFETVLTYYAEVRGMAVMTLKFAAVYGPHDPRGKIIDLLIDALKSGKSLALSPGEQLLDLIQVEDAVRAVLCGGELLEKLSPGQYRSYSVTSGHPVTLKELVEILAKLTGKKPMIQWGAKPYRKREFFKDWVCDERLPNWQPQILLNEGLSRLVNGI